jgi:hypothetical protein
MPSTLPLISLVTLFTPSSANRIRFFSVASCDDSQPFRGCDNIGPNRCCIAKSFAFAASVSKTPIDIAIVYRNPFAGCDAQLCPPTGGEGVLCCISPALYSVTGALFYTIAKKREETDTSCHGEVKENMLGFVNGTAGQWVLTKDAVGDGFAALDAEFDGVPDGDKMEWLQANGAVYEDIEPEAEMQIATGEVVSRKRCMQSLGLTNVR